MFLRLGSCPASREYKGKIWLDKVTSTIDSAYSRPLYSINPPCSVIPVSITTKRQQRTGRSNFAWRMLCMLCKLYAQCAAL